jgi:chromate transporter
MTNPTLDLGTYTKTTTKIFGETIEIKASETTSINGSNNLVLDAIAIGQFTPGPVLSTATFIGYIIAGFPGAIVATLGIFLPSFLLVAALNPFMNPIRNSSWTRPFLDAVNVSAVALMVLTTIQLGIATLILPKANSIDFLGLGISIISAILAIRYRINAAYLILGGGIIGWSALMSGYLG